MIVAEWEKGPLEKSRYSHNFSSKMLPTEELLTVTVAATNVATGVVSTSTIIIPDSVDYDGTEVFYSVQNGTVGEKHLISMVGTTNRSIGPSDNAVVSDEHLLIIT